MSHASAAASDLTHETAYTPPPQAPVAAPSPAAPSARPVLPEELTGVELLAGLPYAALGDLAGHARRRTFRPGEVVFREGDPGASMHVVTRGLLSVVRPSRDPGLVLQRLSPGDVFGEVGVLNSAPRLASIVAVDLSETVEVHKDDLDRVLARDLKAMRHMLGTLALSLTLAKEELARHNSKLESKVRERTAICARASSSSCAASRTPPSRATTAPASTSRA
jgi:CRP-like cAMP-binding protein